MARDYNTIHYIQDEMVGLNDKLTAAEKRVILKDAPEDKVFDALAMYLND